MWIFILRAVRAVESARYYHHIASDLSANRSVFQLDNFVILIVSFT